MKHKTTYAKITINDAGETEVRKLDVISQTAQRSEYGYPILSIDLSQAIERIDQESVALLLRLRETILALHEDDRCRLWGTLRGQICVGCGGNLGGGPCPRCHDSAADITMKIGRNDTKDPNEPDRFNADGIAPERYEQPPQLTAEEEAILDGIWDRLGKRRAAEREADNDQQST